MSLTPGYQAFTLNLVWLQGSAEISVEIGFVPNLHLWLLLLAAETPGIMRVKRRALGRDGNQNKQIFFLFLKLVK